MMRSWFFCFFLIGCVSLGTAQVYEPVFPSLTGEALLDVLVSDYKTSVTLGNTHSKDTLYARVYQVDDQLTCVYTGYTIFLDPNQDPSQAAFAEGINLEHTYPKAMGADGGLAESDMHHLHPTREAVNQARASLPFGEIPDQETQNWWYLGGNQSNIPPSNIDLYSEVLNNERFEPREDHKGNVARAVFYFYTMYEAEANMANAAFFEDQRTTLCDWHFQDPVDQLEYERTYKIAAYQENKPNPFVLDCTVALRTYCDHLTAECFVSTRQASSPGSWQIHPNPVSDQLLFLFEPTQSTEITANIFDAFGRSVQKRSWGPLPAGVHQLNWTNLQLPAGVYILVITSDQKDAQHQWVEKLIFR